MEALRKKRAIIKSTLTLFNNYLDMFISLSDIEDLQLRLDKAIPLLNKFEAMQEEIESLDEVDLDETVRTREDFEREKHLREEEEINISEDSYHKVIGKAKGFIMSKQSIVPSLESVSRSATESPALHSEAGPIGAFDRTIEALGVSEANYLLAWEGLKSRYEDPNTLIHHHVQALFEAPVLTRESTYSKLRQLLDNTNNHLLALRTLGKRTEYWDQLIIYLLTSKLNIYMKREWGRTLANSTTEPTFKEFSNFLERHIKFLQNSETDKIKFNDVKIKKVNVPSIPTKLKQVKTYTTVANKKACIVCKGTHPIYTCEVFKSMPTAARLQKIREHQLCFNCLGDGHRNRECTFGPCRKCGKKHNSLIHLDNPSVNTTGSLQVQVTGAPTEGLKQVENTMQPSEGTSSPSEVINQSLTARVIQKGTKVTMLSTAKLYIYDCRGQRHECRALLDSGSELHIMTTALFNRLGLSKTRSNLALTGIEQGSVHVNYVATMKIGSRTTNFSATITCVVLDKISSNIPSTHINTTDIQIPKGLELADPDYNCSGPVDLIIGASLFLRLLSVGQIFIKDTELVLHKTVLGWIIAGNICLNSPRKLVCNLVKNQDLDNQLERFWKLEHCFIPTNSTTKTKDYSEQHFIQSAKRDETGRFIVSIPFKNNVSELGDSLKGAEKRVYAMERKLSKNPELKKQYTAFMEEYEALGHMTEISPSKYTNTSHFYLPHHAVVKEDSTTTKLRVVFDGSSKSSSSLSLNDVQHIGPTVQDDLFTILVRFRKHSFVLSADIAKMYRQILVNERDRAFQLILWRSDINTPMKYYELNTVTYGTASAPFLATRCLQQLSDELGEKDPITSYVIRHDFYVDDLLTGTDSVDDAIRLKTNLSNTLSSAGFELRKWASNDLRLVTGNKNAPKEAIPLLDKDPKTLGLFWDPVTDVLKYNVKYLDYKRITKRTVTSIIAQIFDPLGLVGPTVIKAKIILQKLWELRLDWDESLPQELHTLWQSIYKELRNINNISIQRHVIDKNVSQLQFHGFCDASESAYGACIYIRTRTRNNKFIVHLLCAKSRVAPLLSNC
nr:PREDICTED: uncharacterized protein LOC105664028 [Megachile rotundata]